MDRMRRIAGMGRSKAPSAVQKDKDESIVFFRELHKRETNADVNLLEPMYSVEFDTIQGGHPSKLHSGKRDFLIQVDEKHDYDWLQTPPAAPLFPSIEMEANYSEIDFQKALPIPRPVKSSASRFSGKLEATKTPARPAPPPPPESSSHKNLFRGAAASMSKEKNHHFTIDRRPPYAAALTNRQQKPPAATASAGASSNTTKKHSDRCTAIASLGSSASAAKTLATAIAAEEAPYKPPKNLLTRRAPSTTMTTRTRAGNSELGAKAEGGKARRPPCPPAATRRGLKELRNGSPAKGKAVTAGDPACGTGAHAGEAAALVKGMKRTVGKIERRPRFATM